VVGVASARNRCLDLATGDVLLWTDDDVRLPRDWIEKMVAPIAQGRMDAVAGGVCLAFGRKREWMGRCLRTWLASSEGLSEGRPGRMIGANMAFQPDFWGYDKKGKFGKIDADYIYFECFKK
jgi:glycosyltransferase involved in cell wall biosynthesis